MKRIIIHLFFLLLPTIVYSAPEISDITGTVITGTDLEADTSPSPIEWLGDNIEGGTPDGTFTKTGWAVSGGNGSPVYTVTQAHSGTKSIYYDLQGLDYGDRQGNAEKAIGNNEEVFFSLWMKTILTLPATCNKYQYKSFRVKNDAGYTMDTGFFIDAWYYDYQTAGNGAFLQWEDSASSGNWWNEADGIFEVFDTWERYDFHLVHSTPSTADGSLEIILVGTGTAIGAAQGGPKTAHETRSSSSDYYSYFRLQAYFLSLGTQAGDDCSDTDITNSRYQVYYDDVYISDTQARVELCDADTWAARNICEVQLLTHRTDSSITFTENQGGFILNDNVFVYVVDSNGEVNQTGTPYTITGNSTPPPSGYPVYSDGESIITGD